MPTPPPASAAPATALKYSTMQDARAFAEFDLDGNQQLDFEEFYASALRDAMQPQDDIFAG